MYAPPLRRPAGTVVIHHEDLFHRRARGGAPEGTGEGCVAFRPMIKRAVFRGSEPTPLFDEDRCRVEQLPHASHRALYAWTLGCPADGLDHRPQQGPFHGIDSLKEALLSTDVCLEQARVDAAYALATAGTTAALNALFEAVEGADEAPARAATNALASAGPLAVPRLIKALWACWVGNYGGAKRLPSKQRVTTAAAHAIGHCVAHLPVGQLGRVAAALVSTCAAALSAIDQRMQSLSRESRSEMSRIAGSSPPPATTPPTHSHRTRPHTTTSTTTFSLFPPRTAEGWPCASPSTKLLLYICRPTFMLSVCYRSDRRPRRPWLRRCCLCLGN